MKSLLIYQLVFLCLLVACGSPEEAEDANKRIGQNITPDSEDRFSRSEVNLIETACAALRDKKEVFERYYVNKRRYNGTLESKTCGQEKMNVEDFSGAIVKTGNAITIMSSLTGTFNEIITDESSEIEDVCQNGTSTDNVRFVKYGNTATWIYPYKGTDSKCGTNSKSALCLYFVTGRKSINDSSYKIQEQELIRMLTVTGTNNGVVTDRKFVSSRFCNDPRQSEVRVQKFVKID